MRWLVELQPGNLQLVEASGARCADVAAAVKAGHPDAQPRVVGYVDLDGVPYWFTETCQWFLRCGRRATGVTPHPVLGEVFSCDRCHERAQ
jgi:hypothetical protein